MKTRKKNAFGVRKILAGMVVDYNVCMRISSQWPKQGDGLFDAPWANMVARWCIDYADRYEQAIGSNLTAKFEDWVDADDPSEEVVSGVENFLIIAEDEWESAEEAGTNTDFILDEADKYFNGVRIEEIMDQAKMLKDRGNTKEAEELLQNYPTVRLGDTTSYMDLAEDWDRWRRAYDEQTERTLIAYPDFMHDAIGKWLKRDQLVSFMAPDKSGKSVYLLDLAVRAARSRCRVAYFDVGDNSQDQVCRRLASRASRIPNIENFEKQIEVPTSGVMINKNGKWVAEIETRTRKFKRPCGPSDGYNWIRKICRKVSRFRLTCYPNSTKSAKDIEAVIAKWAKEDDWVPDVVVIDYADILAAESSYTDTKDAIDDTWRRLRRISQKFHCLVVTATQASAAAYNDKAGVLRKQHFSGRKTKLAHVNGMIGINTNDEDRQKGISRLNWIVRREGRYSEFVQYYLAGSWEWYDPCVRKLEKGVEENE